ncbi:AAA family ATPase [Actinomadura parmotrematis]|uniref:Nuclease SbcCD subunit C n=1 Tax=Actinomadura parmotrematis TaxID=2864039 RepID=A0ABS7G241_9ACTN|nr:SMC family ATPase [Actinomadura parmotrematis]MBW8486785.1 SMC family ATPase [Actinomadura parmotrematis]
MRLHRLEITAFGPFAGSAAIDFEALSDAGLFLVRGRTGAGKTSVLDAVCFAFYGRVPGARRHSDNLRSDHAAAGAAPQVVLETTVRGRRLRITRSPAWQRPKLRGTGTTLQQAKVLVEEHERGSWKMLATRLDEAGDFLTGLLGMSDAQFCQVAMLPQGQFADFLRAKADARREVLSRLFATQVFADMEKWLVERRRATRADADLLGAAAVATGRLVGEVARTGPPGEDDPALLPAFAAELAAAHDDVRAVTADLLAGTAAALDTARTALADGRAVADLRRRHADALDVQRKLNERAEERALIDGRLEAAARADRVVPLVRALRDREQRAAQAARWAAETRAATAGLVPPDAPEDVLAKAEQTGRAEIAVLEGHRATVARLRDLAAARADAHRELDRLGPERDRLAAALEALPADIGDRRASLETARLAAAGREGAAARVADARRLRDAALRRDRLDGLLGDAEDAHRAAVDAAQAARDRVQELRQARLEGMAAVLAADLAPGAPCLVCGSAEHPAPATGLGLVPGEDDEARAEQAYQDAQAARDRASARAAELRAEHDAARTEAGEEPAGHYADALAAAEDAERDLAGAAADAERHAAALHALELEEKRHRDRHDRVQQDLVRLRSDDAARADEEERLRADLAAALGDDATLEERIARVTGEADALARAADALRGEAAAAEELAAARAAAEGAAAEQAFRTPEEAVEAALDDEEQAPLRDKVRWFDEQKVRAAAVLGDRDVRAAAAGPAPDLDALHAAHAAAEDAHAAATGAADRAHRRSARLGELRARLAGEIRAWRPAADRHAVAKRMADLATGGPGVNRHAMSLSAYVLAARLEQVVAAANARLDRMSGGRYVLDHTIDKAAGDHGRKATGGLGLRVLDSWTGRFRDPVTLSGGESFITSLALALGLADVVTAEAGGTEIGTLFVDEGFGTLDEDTLDEVMDVLDGLRDGGRAVGIVSHVAELRARIPAQLHVTKGRAGSTVRVEV